MSRTIQISLTLALIIFLFSIGCSSKTPPASEEKQELLSTEEAEFEDQDFTNSIGMELRLIPAGDFMMGSKFTKSEFVELFPDAEPEWFENEHPQHEVEITNPFYLGVCEVTQGEWGTVMETAPWRERNYVMEGADFPAAYVTWEDAQEFCHRLSVQEALSYRLPTEAEWEYSCRAGSNTAFCFGDSYSDLGEYAWFRDNSSIPGRMHPSEVGQKRANAWGLFDMHGNVYEWCQDRYEDDYIAAGTINPTGPPTGGRRVVRGGGWEFYPRFCRSAERNGHTPLVWGSSLGFRVVCEIE